MTTSLKVTPDTEQDKETPASLVKLILDNLKRQNTRVMSIADIARLKKISRM